MWRRVLVLAAAVLVGMVPACGWPSGGTPLPPASARMRGMTEAGYTASVLGSPQSSASFPRSKKMGSTGSPFRRPGIRRPTRPRTSSRILRSTMTPIDASMPRLIGAAHHDGFRVFLNPFVNSLTGSGWQAYLHPRSAAVWFPVSTPIWRTMPGSPKRTVPTCWPSATSSHRLMPFPPTGPTGFMPLPSSDAVTRVP